MYSKKHASFAPLIRIIDRDVSTQVKISESLHHLGFRVVIYESAQDFLTQDPFTDKGCLVADWLIPDMEGMEFLEELNHRQCPLPVIFYGERLRVHSVVEGMKMGAVSFVEKSETIQRLISEITQALMRPSSFNHSLSEDFERWEQLTPTEQAIAHLITLGLTYQAIGERLGGRSPKTIQNHASAICMKLGVHGRQEIAQTVHWLKHIEAN